MTLAQLWYISIKAAIGNDYVLTHYWKLLTFTLLMKRILAISFSFDLTTSELLNYRGQLFNSSIWKETIAIDLDLESTTIFAFEDIKSNSSIDKRVVVNFNKY